MHKSVDSFFANSKVKIVWPGLLKANDTLFQRKQLTEAISVAKGSVMNFARLYSREKKTNNIIDICFGDFSLRQTKCGKMILNVCSKSFYFSAYKDFGLYLRGKWLEEYVTLQLLALLRTGVLKDIRMGMRVAPIMEYKKFLKELDVVFTDGYYIYIIECKTGKAVNLSGNQESKIHGLINCLGEDIAEPLLVTTNVPQRIPQKIRIISYKDILSQCESLINRRELKSEHRDT